MKKFVFFLIVAMALMAGCSRKPAYIDQNPNLPKGKAYTVRGKTYIPYTSAHGFTELGIASWYGPGFHGKKTSNGERYNQHSMTAAHKLLPFNTRIKVTNLDNGRTTIVRINDRGPFVDNRVIDLSRTAADSLGIYGPGTARVRLEAVGGQPAVLSSDGDMLGAFYVQVGTFSNPSNAARLLKRLRSMGYAGRSLRKNNLVFVQAGPFSSVHKAASAMYVLDDTFPDVFLVAQ